MRDTNDDPQPQSGMFKDIQRLTADAGASVEELREFLEQLRGRSPQQMLGLVAESGLFRGMITATVGIVMLLFVFTVGPWAYNSMAGVADRPQAQAPSAPSTPGPAPEIDAATLAEQAAAQAAASPASANASPGSDINSAAKALGIDETRTGSPDIDALLNKKLDD